MSFQRSTLFVSGILLATTTVPLAGGERLERLQVLGPDFPKAFFFRAAEGQAANPRVSFDQWNETFGRLMGIEGKVLDEEIPGRSKRNIDFFTRFKRHHPRQLVLLHFNGNARDPRDAPADYHAGHWLYYNGAKLLSDLPAESGETTVSVDRPELFLTGIGRYRRDNDDIGLCPLGPDGGPDWSRAEQVQLLAVNRQNKTIRVRRGCFGTRPIALTGGKGYAAAHVSEGPWGRNAHMMWAYNYATTCPRDSQGRQAADILVDELVRWFRADGKLHAFDGLEFDVLSFRKGGGRLRGPDTNADRRPDGGMIGGINAYGIGVTRFLRKLRTALGDDRLILADGHSERHQRSFGVLNGIESEGFPTLSDHRLQDWSGGLNRHAFWAANGRPPTFNYINHKFVSHGPQPGRVRPADVPMSAHRLVFAAALFTDAAVCYSTAPRAEPGERYGIWDELCCGRDRRLGWLGKPLGPAVHLATRQEDRLQSAGNPPNPQLLERLDGDRLRFDIRAGALHVRSTARDVDSMEIRLADIPCPGPDLVIVLTAAAESMPEYPKEIGRLIQVRAGWGRSLVAPAGYRVGIRLRGGAAQPPGPGSLGMLRYSKQHRIAGVTMPGYFAHPPYQRQGKTGMIYWQRRVTLSEHPTLVFFTGMGERAPDRSDGVVFRVEVASARAPDNAQGRWRTVFQQTRIAARWKRHTVSLERWAGKSVDLRFTTDAGPADDPTADHAYWGDVRIGNGPPPERFAPARTLMTWCNAHRFTSYFYFDRITAETIDLQLRIEGSSPLTIHAITAHAAPEVVYRLFQHGMAIANLGHKPAAVSLRELAPNRRFRRLRGSSQQDPLTNNGKPVGNTLTLPPRDALLLVEAH